MNTETKKDKLNIVNDELLDGEDLNFRKHKHHHDDKKKDMPIMPIYPYQTMCCCPLMYMYGIMPYNTMYMEEDKKNSCNCCKDDYCKEYMKYRNESDDRKPDDDYSYDDYYDDDYSYESYSEDDYSYDYYPYSPYYYPFYHQRPWWWMYHHR
ncbi:hypothetical protein BD780_001947 [Clostridium tetanomorphum]|uniref:Uncharacterized protein n=1 Tax=Clostridium tetanomorphum TaxID=1553 RepID=A0A923EB03_CLOTT|nr:hypothetical protein [Clostridium tetanomorphum]KAJ49836.1 hypothetical protein CTM_21231 [Clostridium tetanomorphum DSM 665]MBC2399735.1 hypothetical protein [Clostridium tetanomorphum]MBP1865139.1 hypothetical protein [Clostridium tetanomorphum]NRS84722.1 hypothetical protein [Clostridium tetanomorphum]NRZ97938.1 hypothetical protein [Clostridium tetanomorphum]